MEVCEVSTNVLENTVTEHVCTKNTIVIRNNALTEQPRSGNTGAFAAAFTIAANRRRRRTGFRWSSVLEIDFYLAIIKCMKESMPIIPTNIKNFMEHKDLTREQISSHLQKFRKRKSILSSIDNNFYNEFADEIDICETLMSCGFSFEDYMDNRHRRNLSTPESIVD